MSTNLAPNSPPKHEAFVEQQLARARGRIRALDLLGLLLLLACVTLGYALLMGLADRAWQLPSWARLGSFLLYALAALYLLGLCGYRVAFLRVNPYYAARRLEEAVPDAKNSVVNWLDLRDQPMSPAIRNSLGLRAAKDVAQADPEKAIANRQTVWLGSVAAVLAGVAFIAFLWWGPGTFLSLLQRSFAPFAEIAIAARTNLELLQPEGGDLTVLVNQKVDFRARVAGRVPRPNQADSVKLLYRYNPTDPYVELPMEQDPEGDWVATLLGDQVHNGVWYKVTAGDAATPEYQVKVRANAVALAWDVTYKPRPYRKEQDLTTHEPNLDALRGTAMTILAHTNRTLKDAQLEFTFKDDTKTVFGELLKDDPKTVRFQFVLDADGTYRLLFTSTDNEKNSDRYAYKVTARNDRPPVVKLTVPGKDVTLPANGTLALEGVADDDHGIKSLTLEMRVLKGESQPELAPKEYRPGKSLELKNGRFPEQIVYKDIVALEKLTTKAGESFAPAPGTEIEYRLVAVDNCDYPDPQGNKGYSEKYKVTIAPPEKDQQKQKQERKQAEDRQKQHEKQQDEDLQKRNEKAEQEKKNAEKVNGNGNSAQPDANPENKGQQQPGAKGSDGSKEGEPKSTLSEKELRKREEQLQNELQKEAERQQNKEKNGPGEAKPGEAPKAEPKPGPNPDTKTGDAKKNEGNAQGQKPGEKKDGGATKGGECQAKDGGQGQGQQSADNNAQAKEGAKPGQGREGGVKSGDGKAGGSDKSAAKKQSPDSKSAAARERGRDDGKTKPSEMKDAGNEGQGQTARDQQAPGQVKQQPPQTAKGEKKAGGNSSSADAPKGQGKDGAGSGKAAKSEGKKGPGGSGQDVAQAKDDPNGPKGAGQNSGKEMSREEFNKLKDKLRSGDFRERDKAAEELAKERDRAQDPQTRKAIEKALKEANRDPKQGTETGHAKGGDNSGKKAGPNATAKKSGNSRQSPKEAGDAKSGKPEAGSGAGATRGQGKNDLANAQVKDRAGYGGKGESGEADDPAKTENNPDFAKRAGDLQLEDLKKVTPEMLKKLNWSDKDWRDFRTALEAKRRQEQQTAAKKGGNNPDQLQYGGGMFKSQGGRNIGQGQGGKEGGEFVPTHAPAEFQDAQRIFTSVPLENRKPKQEK